ncbi:MAG: hypothetical protein AAFY84_07070 [Pseudomonadota bacterium]
MTEDEDDSSKGLRTVIIAAVIVAIFVGFFYGAGEQFGEFLANLGINI